jgi:hypothetical protein
MIPPDEIQRIDITTRRKCSSRGETFTLTLKWAGSRDNNPFGLGSRENRSFDILFIELIAALIIRIAELS